MTISLPIPNAKLWPNTRVHWRERSRLVKIARLTACYEVAEFWKREVAEMRIPSVRFTGYTLAFFYPDARRRDDDNAQASCKAYRDGIADALGVDDSTLRLLEIPSFQIDRANPRVEITLK